MNLFKMCMLVLAGRPRVITLDNTALRVASHELADQVRKAGFVPTHICAVANGGIIIGDFIHEKFPEAGVFAIKKQREHSAKKESVPLVWSILRRLPYLFTNILRRAEHWSRYVERDFAKEPVIADEQVRGRFSVPVPNSGEPLRILIVDDAVDRGETIETVTEVVRAASPPGSDIRTAVIVFSGINPIARADYARFRDVTMRTENSLDFHR